MNNPPDLDLTKYAFRRVKHGIVAYGTWYGRKREPALALISAVFEGLPGALPCVIPLNDAFLWAEETGEPRYWARMTLRFAAALGLNPANQFDGYKVLDIIRDNLGDLVMMPPKPTEKLVVADVIRTDEYGRESHHEVTDNV